MLIDGLGFCLDKWVGHLVLIKRRYKIALIAAAMVALFWLVMLLTYQYRFLGHLYDNTPEPYKYRFLSHLHDNTPAPYQDCLVDYVDKHYDELMLVYHKQVEQSLERVPRGRTDTVNYMVATYLPICQN